MMNMKTPLLTLLLIATTNIASHAQKHTLSGTQVQAIHSVIDQYAEARESRDTVLLQNVLTHDVDQLVSTGEWRNGITASVKGMLNSSANTPGTRTLTIEKLRPVGQHVVIVDCKYEIRNPDNTIRRMWSTFVLVSEADKWRICAIRNMLPTGP